MSSSATVTYRTSDDGTTLHATLTGELDLGDADDIRDSLVATARQTGCQRLEADLAEVGFIDSYALGALVSARNSAAADGITMTLVNPSPPVRKALEVTGLSDVFWL
ncbi:STAS domain-containing protein [Actinoplanes aureus]|jgi:anti-anti-sigma factor|uniref:Anti-sigma factor antagonist n=1 Tax=Actinoplanes aureus TaxID=2792083 RepID=A0A931C7M6_9ACTN|nr:STAS domain-containing protein [Actinoplanes aureus]MBG0561551.1 STAS domain-containing protein [Actinoplanes aureus]